MNKCRTSLELFFAIWFVIGNVWVFDSRFGSFHYAPILHVLCISLLAWNALCYSFPFLLFLLLCCVVPLVSSFLGYNMNVGSSEKGASDDQISSLPSWKYKLIDETSDSSQANNDPVSTNLNSEIGQIVRNQSWYQNWNPPVSLLQECCICLAKYKEKEEVRKLPCSHRFHLKCVDQWLRIISCCPLCKQDLPNWKIKTIHESQDWISDQVPYMCFFFFLLPPKHVYLCECRYHSFFFLVYKVAHQ